MSKLKVVPHPAANPPDDTQRMAARLKRHLRDPNMKAVAFVVVKRDGTIAYGTSGAVVGAQHELLAGVTLLQRQVMDGYEP